MESAIRNLEEELRQAMLQSNTETLDRLIDDSLVFIAPSGQIATKQMDLDIHRSKIQKISKLIPSEQIIKVSNDLAIVTVIMDLEGSIADVSISGKYRYLRIWRKLEDAWKIISGSVVKLP